MSQQMNNDIQKSEPPKSRIIAAVEERLDSIREACTKNINEIQLLSSFKKACTDKPSLRDSTEASVMNCMLACATLGLNPNGEHNSGWLIPYKNRKKNIIECKLRIGYNGYIDLITRSSDWFSVTAECVYEGERFEALGGTENTIHHTIDITKRADPKKIVAVYAIARGPNGAVQWVVLDKADLNKSRSASQNKDMWDGADYPEMAKKSGIRKLSKYMVLDRLGRLAVAIMDDTHGYNFNRPVSNNPQDLESELRDMVGAPGSDRNNDQDPPQPARKTVTNESEQAKQSQQPQQTGPVTQDQAKELVNRWSGMSGGDASSAYANVINLAGSASPEDIAEYVRVHEHEDFFEHIRSCEEAGS